MPIAHNLTDEQVERLKLIAELTGSRMESVNARAQGVRAQYERQIDAIQKEATAIMQAEQTKLRDLFKTVPDAGDLPAGSRLDFDVAAKTMSVEPPSRAERRRAEKAAVAAEKKAKAEAAQAAAREKVLAAQKAAEEARLEAAAAVEEAKEAAAEAEEAAGEAEADAEPDPGSTEPDRPQE